MRKRAWLWVFGILGVLAGAILGAGSAQGAALLVVLLVWCLIGLAAELAVLIRSMRSVRRLQAPAGARPADGEVELVPMAAVRSVPNACNPLLQRFMSLEPLEVGAGLPSLKETPVLLGRVVILSLFIGKDGQAWTDVEIAQAHDALERAGSWIEREAMRWSAHVNIEVSATYFVVDDDASEDIEVTFVPEGDHHAPFEAHATSKALARFSRAARQLGFADAAGMIDQVDRRLAADSWVWLIHPRCAGRSLAIPATDTPWPGVTLAVCYAREANFPEPLTGPPFSDPVTFAHELLHLFGASDKYTVPLHTFPAKTVTGRDVMCLNYRWLSKLRIDSFTATEIGWITASRTYE